MAKSNKEIGQEIISHPDAQEIIAKLSMDKSPAEIHDWLAAKYSNQKQLVISKKDLQIFQSEHLDFYAIIREDLLKTHFQLTQAQNSTEEIVKGNDAYQKRLLEIADKELDIKQIVKSLVVKIEFRADQVFNLIQNDPRNVKMDRNLVEWLNLLLQTLEKFDLITNGNPETINIQNNINIQLVDEHLQVIHEIIRDILSNLDYETSLLFTELWSQKIGELKARNTDLEPTEKRLEAAYSVETDVKKKLDN